MSRNVHQECTQERRDNILTAALRVFAQSGFAEATMDRVAAAADLSTASLYSYFPCKDVLLRSVLERYPLLPELPEMMASLGDTPPALGIPTLIAEIWRLLRQRKELARVISYGIQGNAERGKLFAEQIGLPSHQSLAGYLDCWMNRGVLRRQNARAAAQCLIGMLWSFLLTPELIGARTYIQCQTKRSSRRWRGCFSMAMRILQSTRPQVRRPAVAGMKDHRFQDHK